MIRPRGLVLLLVCTAVAAGMLFPPGQAQAAGPNWKVREALGKKEGFLASGTTLNLEQFLVGGAVNIYFWGISESHPLLNEIGTVREARLYLGKVGSSIEVTLETEDRVVLAPNTEKFKEFTIE
jgi:hypothetical protein